MFCFYENIHGLLQLVRFIGQKAELCTKGNCIHKEWQKDIEYCQIAL